MEHYFNESLLYSFIYRHYPFDNLTQELVKNGGIIVKMIIKNIIQSDQSLSNLKNQSIDIITNLVTEQFSYRIGGIQCFYGAFANFYLTHKHSQQHRILFSQNQYHPQKIQSNLTQNILHNQDIKIVQIPFKDRLKEISYIHKITNHLPFINQKQISNKKVNFFKNFINFQETQPKKTFKKYRKKNSNFKTNSVLLPKFDNFSCSFSKIQEQIKTQVDEFQALSSKYQQNFVLSQMKLQQDPKQTKNKPFSTFLQNERMEEQVQTIKSSTQSQLILSYDQLLPEKIRHKSKRGINVSRI